MKSADFAAAAPAELLAPPHWLQIDFLSDLHLGPQTPATLAALRRHLLDTTAQAIFLLGDIFEVWIGDDARTQPFEAECLSILRDASERAAIFFMAGNRDFLVGRDFLDDCQIQGLADPTSLFAFGQRWLLSHGDAQCLADLPYQAFRSKVRCQPWQAEFLALPIEQRQTLARQMRDASQASQASNPVLVDLDEQCCIQMLEQAGSTQLIHGHTHRPATHSLAPGMQRHVLSDWDFDCPKPRGDLLRLSSSGLQRIQLG